MTKGEFGFSQAIPLHCTAFKRQRISEAKMIRKIRAVIFDLGGVLLPQPQKAIALYEQQLGLPKRFLPELFLDGVPNNSFCKLEEGIYTVSEFCEKFDAEARAKADREGVYLPSSFNSLHLLQSFDKPPNDTKQSDLFQRMVNKQMLNAAKILRKHDILTCILTNNWIDDQAVSKEKTCRFMVILRMYFNEVVQSAHIGIRKPSPDIYTYTCKKLGVAPEEAVFLDDLGINLKSARQLGITCIKVEDPTDSLKELEKLCGLNLQFPVADMLCPPPCIPEKVCHSFVQVNKKVNIHFVDVGVGPAVVLIHGFPDCWYGWRYQISALACMGYRVIAPDVRGYGDSSAPPAIEDYSQQNICNDFLSILDALCISQATVIGHDWGGSIAWNLALVYPDRFKAVCGVNTPFFPINPEKNPLVNMYKNPGVFDYQLYFQTPGVAEKEFESNLRRTFSLMLQGVPKEGTERVKSSVSTANVRERGGMLAGMPEEAPPSSFLSESDLKYYMQQFKKSGFRGPLNRYRNYETDWKWLSPFAKRKITIPALMVTASHDFVLKPEYSYGMEKRVTNLTRLHIDRCSHWTPQEKGDELSMGIINWLNKVHNMPPAKL